MIVLPNITVQAVDDNRRLQQAIYVALSSLVDQQVLDGDGNPNGVLDAPYKSTYWDFTNSKMYFKSTQRGSDTGWVAIS